MSSSRSRSVQSRGGEEREGGSRGESFLDGTLWRRASESKVKESTKTEIEEQQRQLQRTGCHPRRGAYPEVGRKTAGRAYQTRIAADAGAPTRTSRDVKREYSRDRLGSTRGDVLQHSFSAKQGRAIATGVRRTDAA
eukprot:1438040-Amphidinium_carterae.1